MLTIFLLTRNRDEGLKKCLESVVTHMRGDYQVLVGNCSDNWKETEEVLYSVIPTATSIIMVPETPIHEAYNALVKQLNSKYACWLADDLVLEQDLSPLIPFLKGYQVVGLPMKDVIKYPHDPLPVDSYGCVNNYHKGKKFVNHAMFQVADWLELCNTTTEEQIDLFILHRYGSIYWPQGLYLIHERRMDLTRQNRIL